MKEIKLGHIVLNGMKCGICQAVIEAGTGVFIQVAGKTLQMCDDCLSAAVRFREKTRTKETKEIAGVFYVDGDTPPAGATGFTGRRINPNVVYDAPAQETPKEAPKYRPKIPPRRPSP